jgi:abortive infection bacteriophage resistance protein
MSKPFMTYDQQIEKLKEKHLMIASEENAKAVLHRYGYFALITGYKDLLKNRTTRNYLDGTTFENIVAIYQFDEQLRELTFRYLLHIERHIRSSLSYGFCNLFGENQGEYLNKYNYDISSAAKEKEVDTLIGRYLLPLLTRPTQYAYIEHHKNNHQNVPLWVLVNALTFGTVSKIYEYAKPQIQSAVSMEFEGITEQQLKQLLRVLTDFRNVCAHNERLFTHRCAKYDIPDLPLHKKLSISKNGQEYVYGKRDYFSVVLAFRYMLPHKDFLTFKQTLSMLLDHAIQQIGQFPMPELLQIMGMPANWKKITSYKKIEG